MRALINKERNMEEIKLIHGDCLEEMKNIPDQSIDLVLTDPPYGNTQCKWDSVIPFEPMWNELKRITKETGVIALHCSQPFTSSLIMSNPKMYKHEWIWLKNRGSNFANTVREPMKEHESIAVFSHGKWTYNKQMQERTGGGKKLIGKKVSVGKSKRDGMGEINHKDIKSLSKLRVPSSWQKFNVEVGKHPTQKPVALLEYLVRTYTKENETVLDFTMGSGSTGVACKNLNRKFIGIEKDLKYFEISKERLEKMNSYDEIYKNG